MSDNPELVSVPQDLTLLSTEDLTDLESRVVAEFTRLNEEDTDVTPEALESQVKLANGIDRIRAELAGRAERDKRVADAEKQRLSDEKARLHARVLGQADAPVETEPAPAIDAETIAAAAARAVATVMATVMNDRNPGEAAQAVVASLADAQRYAPATTSPVVPRAPLAIRASVDIPGVARGDSVTTLEGMAELFHRKARAVTDSRGAETQHHVATITHQFEHVIDSRNKPVEIEQLLRHITRPELKEELVAGGGWCAPSETRYDFFNIACTDGLVDLPTVGASRGGLSWPISPSLADVFDGVAFGGFSVAFSNASVPWVWTEGDDVAAVTGAPTKPCFRVPCPDFDEERLECYGVCVTAGNLTDDAYPEATQNTIQLVMQAHDHAMNGRFLANMAALSAAAVTGGAFAGGGPAYSAITNGIALAATDYRARYGMCEDDILEVVIPNWILGAIQADLATRTGTSDLLAVTRSRIEQLFAARNVRVQFVGDWFVRANGQFGNATSMTAWPTSVTLMMYAAGTFIKGNGLTLDLGVVRDSTLNETNDHTAAWSEECHFIAKVGHESRRYTIAFEVAGDACCFDTTP